MAKSKKKEGLFTKAALEKLSSPEQLDVMMEVTKPAGWISLSAVGFLLLVVILWSVFGSIPTTVDGQGILMRGVALVDVEAKTEGSIEELLVQTGDEVEAGQPIALVSQGGLQVAIQTLKEEITQKTSEFREAEEQAGAATAKQTSSLNDSLATLKSRIQSQETALRDAENSLDRAEESYRQQLITRAQVDAARATVRTIAEGILQLEQQTKEIPGQIAALEAQLSDLRRRNLLELSSLQRDLENKERARNSATKVFSVATGRVLELRVRAGTLVTSKTVVVSLEPFDREVTENGSALSLPAPYAGTLVEIAEVGSVVKEKGWLATIIVDGERKDIVSSQSGRIDKTLVQPEIEVKKSDALMHFQPVDIKVTPKPLQAVIYVPAGDGKHINKEDVVRISPSTVKAEEYGFMLGEVMSISGYPITPAGMMETLKNESLVQEFAGDSSPLEVNARLKVAPDTVSGYEWSSGSGPPIGIQGGTKCTVSIVVDERRPISYVLPILKGAVGL